MTPDSPDTAGVIGPDTPDALRRLRNITITQHQESDGLSGGLLPGQADPALLFGDAAISADQIRAGGFSSLALRTSDLFVFKGDLNLSLSRSLSLAGGILTVSDETPNINVALSAAYVSIKGFTEVQAPVEQYNPGLNNIVGSSLKTNDQRVLGDGRSARLFRQYPFRRVRS